MKYRHKTKIFAFLFIINILFIILYPKSFNLNFNNVVADSKSFTLEDGFETFIENKIYSENENLTITEYFKDYYGDSCDFEEDDEDFNFQYQAGTHAYNLDAIDGNLQVNVTSDTGISYFTLMYRMDNDNLSIINYDYLEVSARCNYTVHNPTIGFGSKPITGFEYFPTTSFPLTTSFQTFRCKIDINEEYFENITDFLILFKDTDNYIINYEYYKFEVEYIKIYRNNITDYATQELTNSWDWSEGTTEEDTSFISATSNGYGYRTYVADWNYMIFYSIDNSDSYYNNISFKIWSDVSISDSLFYVVYCEIGSNPLYYQYGIDLIADTWITYSFNYEGENWLKDITEIRFTIHGDFNDYPFECRLDYMLFTHNNLDDNSIIHQSQDTSFYRASSGLYSYYHKIDKNYTFYEDFTVNLNSCIIIDIPTLTMFPQKIVFNIFSNSYFNISFFIGTTEYILYEKTTINSWLSIRKNINRENYLINETDIKLYFKIYSDYTLYDNYLEYYIDNLEIIYTEVREQYEYYAEAVDTEYNDYWNFNTTNNYFFAEPSGVGEHAMGGITDGCKYVVTSNDLFSRRAYQNFKFNISNRRVDLNLHQYSTFTIDKEYYIVTNLQIINYLVIDDYVSSKVTIRNRLFIDGVQQNLVNEIIITDYFFPEMYNFEFNVEIVQEDYNTIRVSSNYESLMSGNSTSAQPFSFEINTGDIKNALNIFSFYTWLNFSPSKYLEIPLPSNPTIIVTIERSITHSDVVEDSLIGDLPIVPIWDEDLGFWKNIWNSLKYIASSIWESLMNMVFIGGTVKEFFNSFVTFFENIPEFIISMGVSWETLWDMFDTLFPSFTSIINSLVTIVTSILDIVTGVSTIGDLLGDLLTDFFIGFLEFWFDLMGIDLNEDWVNFKDSFVSDDWEGAFSSFGNILSPLFEIDVVSFWSATFGGFFTAVFGFDFIGLFDTAKEFFSVFAMVSTILIVMYMIHLFKLFGSRDWDRGRTEISGIVKVTSWLVSASITVAKWLIDVVISIINIIVPF